MVNRSEGYCWGRKKVRFGAGKVTGIGGGVHSDETVRAATVREMREETGILVDESDPSTFGSIDVSLPLQNRVGITMYISSSPVYGQAYQWRPRR